MEKAENLGAGSPRVAIGAADVCVGAAPAARLGEVAAEMAKRAARTARGRPPPLGSVSWRAEQRAADGWDGGAQLRESVSGRPRRDVRERPKSDSRSPCV